MLLRNGCQENFERFSSKSQQILEKPSRKTSLKSLEKPTNSLQKTSEKLPRKPPLKSLEKQTSRSSKRTSQKNLGKPLRKVCKTKLETFSKETLKNKEKPTIKVLEKSLSKPFRKSSRKSVKIPSNGPSQETVVKMPRKAPQKSLEMLTNNVSEKRVKKPSRKALQNILDKQPTKVSQKTKKAVHLSSQKSLESSSKALASKQSNICLICKKNFTSKKNLNKHNTKHHFLRHCPNCSKTFRQTRTFIYHLRSHLEDHPYECKICLESFNQKKDLLAHKVVHRNSSRLCCDVCPEIFPHLASLNRHRLAHCGPPYACDDCGAIFSNVPDRTVHSKNHIHRCILCPKEVVAFPSNLELAAHMYKVHRTEDFNPGESEVIDTYEPCVSTGAVNLEDDNDSDSMNDSLSSDCESDADEDSNYQIDAVESVYNLKRKDKFICFICYDLYPSCELLKSHMKAHNWYPCNSCPRYFSDANTLKSHECAFAEESSFRCPKCNSECENCKKSKQIAVDTSEINCNASQSIVPRFPEMSPSGVTNYTDRAQRNCLNNFIQHIKSQKGCLDLKSFNLIGFHCTNLQIIIKNPAVNCLFPRQCIHDLEELYSKFQNLSQVVLNRLNQSTAQ